MHFYLIYIYNVSLVQQTYNQFSKHNLLPSLISIIVGHFDYKHRCLVEKNVPIVLIFPSRSRDGAESLGIEH